MEVWIEYLDREGKVVRRQILEFYPPNDLELVRQSFKPSILSPNEVIRFHTTSKNSTINDKLQVDVIYKTLQGESLNSKKTFDLVY